VNEGTTISVTVRRGDQLLQLVAVSGPAFHVRERAWVHIKA